MPDTSRDVRILAVERLIAKLDGLVRQRGFGSHKQTREPVRRIEELASKVAALRYSYMEDDDLASFDETRAIGVTGHEIAELLSSNPGIAPLRLAFLGFFEAVLAELPEAFSRPR